jgi:hypothetical protein
MKNSKSKLPTNERSYAFASFFYLVVFVLLHSLSFGQTSQTKVGLTYANSAISGSNSSWTSITNANSSDDVYVVTATNLPHNGDFTDYLNITNFQFNIPLGSTISGIEVNVERSDINGKSKDSKVSIIKGGSITTLNKAQSPAWSGTDNVQNYGGNIDLWSNTWNVSDVNSTGFGFAFSAKRTGGGGQPTSSKIDQVSITVYYTNPLPIQLLEFTAKYTGEEVNLKWETASEINNDYFSIERSNDGVNFETVATIKGANNSTINKEYSFTDETPLFGTSYYRLKQTDFDGKSETFKTVAVTKMGKLNQSESMVVYSNHFDESLTAKVQLTERGSVEIQVISINGGNIISQNFQAEEGMNLLELNANGILKAGVYIIRLVKDNKVLATTKTMFVK